MKKAHLHYRFGDCDHWSKGPLDKAAKIGNGPHWALCTSCRLPGARSDLKKRVNPRSLKNLRPWQKGESGNPGGRPRKPISDAYADLAEHPFPGDKHGRTYAQRLAEAQFRAAINGRTEAAREIANRIEGPAEKPQVEIVPGADPLRVRIETPDLLSAIRQIYGLGSPDSSEERLRPPRENPNEPLLDQFME